MSCNNVPAPASTSGIDALLADYSMTEDAWDDNMRWCFAVAEVIWHLTAEEVPATMEFNHSPVSDKDTWREEWEVDSIASLYEDGTVTDDDLINFAEYVAAVDADFRSRGENY